MGQVVSVVNQKGGVGKTTVTLGLASAARARGHRVLVIDLDPQGASSWVLGIEPGTASSTIRDVLGSSRGASAHRAITASGWGHLVDVVAADPGLQELEVIRGGLETLVLGAKTETRLRRGIHRLTDGYGVVLIDCPPSLGALTTNGLAAADHALIVAEPSALSLRGVEPVADLIDSVWEHHNATLDLAGVVVNRMPARSHDAGVQFEELTRSVGRRSVWEPPIPHRVVLAEAAAAQKPIHDMGAKGRPVAEVFDQLYGRLWRLIKPARA